MQREAPPAAILRIGHQIADALDALHRATDEHGRPLGMLHRDVTPGNIMAGHNGNARLIDLGIARSAENRAQKTRTGCMRGTLRYLAPELFDNQDSSPQSNLWSLGLVLLEALLGRQVFRGTDAEIVGKILSGKAMKLMPGEKLDRRLKKAIAPLLRQDPKDRPQRARDVAAMFAMLEKDYADSRAEAAACVLRAAGPPRQHDAVTPRSRRLLVESAVATFCGIRPEGIGEEATVAEEPGAPRHVPAASIYSAPTDIRGRRAGSLPSQPPQLEPTGLFEPSSGLLSSPFSRVPRTPAEELLEYAAQLRGFERSGSSSQPRPKPPRAVPPPLPREERSRTVKSPPALPPDEEAELWAMLPPTEIEPIDEEASGPMFIGE